MEDNLKRKIIDDFLVYCDRAGWIKNIDKGKILNDYFYSDCKCPHCKSNNVIDVDDHWSRCLGCNFSFVGC